MISRCAPSSPFRIVSAALAAACLWAAQAHAETLRCNGRATELGDTRISVLRHCGEPVARDAFCAPVFVASALHPLPSSWVGGVVPCLQVDEWLYDRGPGNLSATVRFQHGRVQAITYGREPL